MSEPLLAGDEIQGNILSGFNKDYQALVALRFGDVRRTREWLAKLVPVISTLREVEPHNRLFRELRARRGDEPSDMTSSWTNVAFSYGGLNKLTNAMAFGDKAFRIGMAKRATLGDPKDPSAEGAPVNWKVGAPGKEPDLLVILASDRLDLLRRLLDERVSVALESGLEVLYQEIGVDPSHYGRPRGREHFGFKDGVSQPAVRGRLSYDPDRFLSPRLVATDSDPDGPEYARPGRPLIWPGDFVFGYPMQLGRDPRSPGPIKGAAPPWANDGSYLVFRRLRQDVARFWRFMRDEAGRLQSLPGFAGMSPMRLAAMLIGRWPSGAPIVRSPAEDMRALGEDAFANDHFLFDKDVPRCALDPALGYPENAVPEGKGDPLGIACPFAGHIRKVNPRDQATDLGGPSDTLTRRMLRRGIPFGEPLNDPDGPDPQGGERGLLFLSYQSSIENQFETLVRKWMNTETGPREGGFDVLVGQNGVVGAGRARDVVVNAQGAPSHDIHIVDEWVIPTGGGYFFAPSISAMRDVLVGNG